MGKWLALVLCASLALPASAYFQIDLNKAKRPAKPVAPWTLADWLAQKNKNRLADHWLALHSSSQIFALDGEGGAQQYTFKSTGAVNTTQSAQAYGADFFISIFDIRGEYRKTNSNEESFAGAAGLRLLGESSQTTSLVARYGMQKLTHLTTREQWTNPYLEGLLQLYIISAFGWTGSYRYYFPATSNLAQRLTGYKATGGAFVEFGAIRIYVDYFQEPLDFSSNGILSKQESDGVEGGLKIFF